MLKMLLEMVKCILIGYIILPHGIQLRGLRGGLYALEMLLAGYKLEMQHH